MTHVFVWTIGDLIGLAFLVLILFIGVFMGVLNLIDRVKRWRRK